VSQKNEQHKGAWSSIASVLPNRSVQSCHNHCRRKFNPYNYRGAWSEDEVELLLNYVKKHGREWEKIGQMIGRTGLNVRDKYKEIGGKNNTFRKRSKWTVQETISLIKYVEKYSKVKILRESIDEIDYTTFDATYKPKRISKTNVKFQPDAIMVSSKLKKSKNNPFLAHVEPIHQLRHRTNHQLQKFAMDQNRKQNEDKKQG
jgi:hypothetical protein